MARGPYLSDQQRLAWLRLIRSDNVGPATFRQLLNHFGSADRALTALPDLSRRGGSTRSLRICSHEEAEQELALAHQTGARLVAIGEPDYPPLLRHVEAPPPLLALRGDAEIFQRPCIAIVGARNASLSGKKLAALFASELGQQGVTVVSGLALGIDGAAHKAALDYGTAVVFASGVDKVYPRDHRPLMEDIFKAQGAAISEMPMGWEPRPRDFPRRNRIISGCSYAVVVIEAAERSGSLHTARFAADQGREVLVVPGSPLDPRSAGSNRLIREGATLVRSSADIMEVLLPLKSQSPQSPLAHPGDLSLFEEASEGQTPEADQRNRLIDALSTAPTQVDDLIQETGLSARTVQIVLLELEIAGRLDRSTGGLVSLVF